MLTYERLIRKPRAFRSLTGLDIDEFDRLYAELSWKTQSVISNICFSQVNHLEHYLHGGGALLVPLQPITHQVY